MGAAQPEILIGALPPAYSIHNHLYPPGRTLAAHLPPSLARQLEHALAAAA